jgi:uncharacterized protein
MRVAITGSRGLIGTALTASLAADGHDVVPVVRSADETAPNGVVRWDIDAGTIDRAGLEGVDAVVHLAGAGIGDRRLTEDRKRVVATSRSRGTALLADALADLEHKPQVMVSASAIGYYGERGDEVLTETSTAQPGNFLSDVCVAWEAATAPAAAAEIRVARIRSGIVLAAHGGALARMLPLFKFGLGGRMGSGRQWWSWVSLADEVGAIRFVLDHDIEGPVNATAPSSTTNADFTKALGQALHRPAVLPVPRFGPRLVLGRERADLLLFTSERVEPRVLSSAGFEFRHPDIESAFASLESLAP